MTEAANNSSNLTIPPPTPFSPSSDSESAGAASQVPIPGGTLEHTMAKISLDLEDRADRASQLARRERATRRQLQKAERKDRMRAAKLRLAGAVVEAGAQAASSAVSVSGVATDNTDLGKAYAEGAQAEGKMMRGAIDHFATRSDIEAEAHSDAADAAGERAGDARAAEDQLRRFADKAQGHIDSVSEATHQARMEIARSVRG